MKNKIKSFFDANPMISLKSKDVYKNLGLSSLEEYSILKQELHLLVQKEYLIKIGKRYTLNKREKKIVNGVFQIARQRNYGFVIPQNSKLDDIFIPERAFYTALNGDWSKLNWYNQSEEKVLKEKL